MPSSAGTGGEKERERERESEREGKKEAQPASARAGAASEYGVCVRHMCTVGVLMAFLYVSDRTGIFLKESKEFTWGWFLTPCLVLLVGGLTTLSRASSEAFLNRDQTDEWKGWMQLLILVYHFTGASSVLNVYVFVRVCVAAYLFMTGYGHFLYFESKGDFGWVRLTQVLLRVNIFVIALVLIMDRG